jgi:hypothetical protein
MDSHRDARSFVWLDDVSRDLRYAFRMHTTIFSTAPEIWIPLRLDPNDAGHPPSLRALARLRPGVSLAAANANARVAGEMFRRGFPDAAGPNDTLRWRRFRK